MKLSIDRRWKWAAMDIDGSWVFYKDRPKMGNDEWEPSSEAIPGSRYLSISSVINGFPYCNDWRDSLHQIVNGRLVKFEEPKESPAVTRAREILEECGIIDVQGTPADQLRPLVELVEAVQMGICKCRWVLK